MNLITNLRERNFDAVFDSQRIFHILMNCFSFPGKIYNLPNIKLSGIEEDLCFILLPILTLCDLETSFTILSDNKSTLKLLRKYIELNTSSNYTDISNANYVVNLNSSMKAGYKKLNIGSLENPDTSTTIFYQINNLNNKTEFDINLLLTGPGIKNTINLSIDGVLTDEINDWIDDRLNYPLGIDICLIDKSGRICGLPRSTKIKII